VASVWIGYNYLHEISKHWPLDFDDDVVIVEIDEGSAAFQDCFGKYPATLTALSCGLADCIKGDLNRILADGFQAVTVIASRSAGEDALGGSLSHPTVESRRAQRCLKHSHLDGKNNMI
jgi:hypothetical protein